MPHQCDLRWLNIIQHFPGEEKMRFKKAILKVLHKTSRTGSKLYYWSEKQLYDLRYVTILPIWFWRSVYIAALKLSATHYKMKADWLMHRVPFSVRHILA